MIFRKHSFTGLLASFSFSAITLQAEDWPHWLGPNGDNIVAAADNFDPDLNNWKVAWQKEVGLGYSTVTSANGLAYTMGHDGQSTETILCFDAETGEKQWEYSYQGQLIPAMHVGGPNASVTVSGEVVYTLSKDGRVLSLDAKTGEVKWSTQLTEVLDMDVPKWGFGSSPIEYQGDLIISAGKTVALDKNNGRPSWTSETAYKPGYGSPVVFTNGGKDFIASMDSSGLSILDATHGKEVARHEVRSKYNMVATTPAVFNNGKDIYIFTDMQTEVLGFDGSRLSSQWKDRKLKNSLSGSLLIDGTLYGVNGSHKNSGTELYARNLSTGEKKWSVPNFGYASMIAVGDTLLILTEDGDLVTAPVNAKEYSEISRKKLLDAICWTNPTYVDGRIFIRNEHGVLIVLERA